MKKLPHYSRSLKKVLFSSLQSLSSNIHVNNEYREEVGEKYDVMQFDFTMRRTGEVASHSQTEVKIAKQERLIA